jgi:hypothetical protein
MSTGTPLLREELVEASVLRAITTGLPNYGIALQTNGFAGPAPNVIVRESFPTPDERETPLSATTLAFGFNVDDGGEQAELGSTLTKYVHTLTAWIFALEPRFGRKVAYAIQHVCRVNLDLIPLLDFNADPASPPQIDALNTLLVQVEHMGNNSVRPWDKYVWCAHINVRDCYYVV